MVVTLSGMKKKMFATNRNMGFLLKVLRLEFYDDVHSIDEDRYITIGKVENVLFVVFTERNDGDSIRLISARLATAKERRLYYGDA